MTGRIAIITLVLAGCAAAAPATYRAVEGLHAGHGAAHGFTAGSDHGCPIQERIEAALDGFGLSAETRAQVDEVIRAHVERARGLMERMHAGSISHDAAMTEHEEIVKSAMEALKPLLTDEQIRRLHDAIHP